MRPSLFIQPVVIGLALSFGSAVQAQSQAQSERPWFIRQVFIGENFVLAVADPITNEWMRIEVSSDLVSWAGLVNFATTNQLSPFIYGDDTASAVARRFYRISAPGTSVEQARTLWKSQNVSSYSFSLQHTFVGMGRIFRGKVMVRNGKKTVTDVTLNGEPVIEFDPDDFPTIEELFDLLEGAANQGVRSVWVRYEGHRGFPCRCLIDNRDSPGSFDISEYRLSDFQIAPPGGQNGAPRNPASPNSE